MEVKLDATGLPQKESVPYVPGHEAEVIFEQSVYINEETLVPDVKVTERDLDAEIQSYKDECGMAFILRQIASGRLSVDQIRDHGNEGMDITGTPETINDACQVNLDMQEQGAKAAQELGMKTYTEEEFQKAVAAAVKAAAEAKAAQAQEVSK